MFYILFNFFSLISAQHIPIISKYRGRWPASAPILINLIDVVFFPVLLKQHACGLLTLMSPRICISSSSFQYYYLDTRRPYLIYEDLYALMSYQKTKQFLVLARESERSLYLFLKIIIIQSYTRKRSLHHCNLIKY